MGRNTLRRGINNAYSSSLFSKYVERMNESVPRGTKHEVMPSQTKEGYNSSDKSGKTCLPSK